MLMFTKLLFCILGNKRVVFDLKENNLNGIPDGMTIDANDNLWVVIHDAGTVRDLIFNISKKTRALKK